MGDQYSNWCSVNGHEYGTLVSEAEGVPKKKKVYCCDCEYFLPCQPIALVCEAPENMPENWHSPAGRGGNDDKKPSEINKNNDCTWYKEKDYGHD